MEKTLEEYNKLFPAFSVTEFTGDCEVVETNPASDRDFQKLTISDSKGFVFPRTYAGESISFYSKAKSPAPMLSNCDGLFFAKIGERKCLFACELKSSFDSDTIFHAREQIIGTILRFRAHANMLQTRPNWEYHGVIVSYEPSIEKLVGLKKLTNNEARFAQALCALRHKDFYGNIANSYYYPLDMPDLRFHYIGVPNRQNTYNIPIQTLVNL